MNKSTVIIQTTVSKKSIAKKISTQLIKKRLAACVSIIPNIKSIYRWENKISFNNELEIQIKTSSDKITRVEEFINRTSDYDCPQFIVSHITYMSNKYKKWFEEQLS